MIIRKYTPADCEKLAQLFYDTVHTINAKDYSKEQLDAWATGNVDLEKWNISFLKHYTVVATLSFSSDTSYCNKDNILKKSLLKDENLQIAFLTVPKNSKTFNTSKGTQQNSHNDNIIQKLNVDKATISSAKNAPTVENDEIIIGFGDIDETGYLDRLYVHKDYQHIGVATAICNQLEEYHCEKCKKDIHKIVKVKRYNYLFGKTLKMKRNANKFIIKKPISSLEFKNKKNFFHFTTHASITAKGFFEKRGYKIVKEQQVMRNGVLLTNFLMEKQISSLPTKVNF